MAARGIKETEKDAVGAIRTALQTWLAPQLSDISARLTHVEARLDGIDKRLDGMDRHFEGIDQRIGALQQQMAEQFRSMHGEFEARIDAVRIDIKRLGNIAVLRERLASVEAKLAQHN